MSIKRSSLNVRLHVLCDKRLYRREMMMLMIGSSDIKQLVYGSTFVSMPRTLLYILFPHSSSCCRRSRRMSNPWSVAIIEHAWHCMVCKKLRGKICKINKSQREKQSQSTKTAEQKRVEIRLLISKNNVVFNRALEQSNMPGI